MELQQPEASRSRPPAPTALAPGTSSSTSLSHSSSLCLIATLALLPHLRHEVPSGEECTRPAASHSPCVHIRASVSLWGGLGLALPPSHLGLKNVLWGQASPAAFLPSPPQSRGHSRKCLSRKQNSAVLGPGPTQVRLMPWSEPSPPEGQGIGLSRCVHSRAICHPGAQPTQVGLGLTGTPGPREQDPKSAC